MNQKAISLKYQLIGEVEEFLEKEAMQCNDTKSGVVELINRISTYKEEGKSLIDYLHKSILALSEHNNTKPSSQSMVKPLTWTDSKVGLVEMCYSFKAKGTFNNGKATLKEISEYLQYVLHVELNNPSRDLQEILRRKNGYTTYIDSLKESYLKYIDAIEDKDRR